MKVLKNNMKRMRDITACSLIIAMLFVLSGCGNSAQERSNSVENNDEVEIEETHYEYSFRELPEPVCIQAALEFAGGNGTEDEPYQISTKEELALLSEVINDDEKNSQYSEAFYELTEDIVLNEGYAEDWAELPPQYSWKTIGQKMEFKGSFNGNGHTISGIYVNVDDSDEDAYGDAYGFFGNNYGIIKNVNIENTYICISGYSRDVGTIVGKLANEGLVANCNVQAYMDCYDAELGGVVGENHGEIISCTFAGKIEGQKEQSSSMIGGIVGSNFGEIEKCINDGEICIQGEGADTIGGIVGRISDGKVADCQNNGVITGATRSGGIAGYVSSSNIGGEEYQNREIYVENCRNTGKAASAVNIGGIVGEASNDRGCPIIITNCGNSGVVEADEKCGGIVGKVSNGGIIGGDGSDVAEISIKNCANTSDLSCNTAGGIVGSITGMHGTFVLSNCDNSGSIVSDSLYAGGIVGEYYTCNDISIQVMFDNCTNTGKIETKKNAGGIIGGIVGIPTSVGENANIAIMQCVNKGEIYTNNGNAYIGGIVGGLGAKGVATKITDCINKGNLVVEDNAPKKASEEELEDTQTFALTRMCGGIVGRVGSMMFVSTDVDNGNSENINTESAVVVIDKCYNAGAFQIPDEDKYLNENKEPIYTNEIGGIIGNCSAEDEYSVNVVDCGYTNAERGLGTIELPDIGNEISTNEMEGILQD